MSPNIGFTDSIHFQSIDDLPRTYTDLHLSYCGKEDTLPGFVFGPAVRHEYALHIVKSGRGSFTLLGKTYHLQKNQVFLIPPDVETRYQADLQNPWSYFWIGFNGLRAHEIVSNAGFTLDALVKDIYCLDELHKLVTELLSLRALTFANELRRTGILMQFWAILIEEHATISPSPNYYNTPGSVHIRSAVDYMTRNYNTPIKISDIASLLGINRSTFTLSFKNALGISPQEYLLTLRMNKAASLLKNTSFYIAEIAAQVGYKDPLAFSRIFHKQFGLSPRAFRESPDILVIGTEKGSYSNLKPL